MTPNSTMTKNCVRLDCCTNPFVRLRDRRKKSYYYYYCSSSALRRCCSRVRISWEAKTHDLYRNSPASCLGISTRTSPCVRACPPPTTSLTPTTLKRVVFYLSSKSVEKTEKTKRRKNSLFREKSPEGYPLVSRSSSSSLLSVYARVARLSSSSCSWSSSSSFRRRRRTPPIVRWMRNCRCSCSPESRPIARGRLGGDDRLHSRRGGHVLTTRMFSFVSLPRARQQRLRALTQPPRPLSSSRLWCVRVNLSVCARKRKVTKTVWCVCTN